jgi:putative ABC transport system permease protein
MSNPPDFKFYSLVLQNLKNRPYRNIATVFAFAVIAATIFSSQYLIHGAKQSLDSGMSRMGADILVVPEEYAGAGQTVILIGQPNSFFFNDSGFEKISRIPGITKASSQIYIATLFASCCAAPVQMIAIDQENDFTVSPYLKANPGVKMGKDDMIIGSAIIQSTGNDLMFYGHTFHVVGILERTGTGIDNSVFVRSEDAYIMADESELKAVKKLTIPRGMVSAVLVKVDPGASPTEVARMIQDQVPGTKTLTPDGLLNAVSGQLSAVIHILYGSTIAVMVVSIPLLGIISAMVTRERSRELAILQALGATKGYLMKLVLAESFSLSIIGGFFGIGAAVVILVGFEDFIASTLRIPFVIPSPLSIMAAAGSALILVIVMGGIASLYPAFLITRSDPFDTIRRGTS